ncbi:MAG: hydrolase [Bacteroidota bacterium]
MKSRIFMYLFIFSVLLIIFQYVNSKNILDDYEKKITRYETKQTKYQDSIKALQDENFELSYFRIENNDDALEYFESAGYRIDDLLPVIRDELYKMNEYEGDDHPIVPYVSMTDSKMLVNKVRILNHKWIIANFTDGQHWGEIFVNYSIDEDNNLKYVLTDYFMYPLVSY